MWFPEGFENTLHKPNSVNSSMSPIGRFTNYTFLNTSPHASTLPRSSSTSLSLGEATESAFGAEGSRAIENRFPTVFRKTRCATYQPPSFTNGQITALDSQTPERS